MDGALDTTRKVCDDAASAISAITEIEFLLEGGGCPLPDRLASKYLLRCKSMATELQRIADQCAVEAVDGATRRIYGDAETAIAAIADIEHLLQSGDCPLPDQATSEYLSRCKSMVTELQGMADEWSVEAEAP